ncbi:F-type H+-transporting ATPase subunit delta [Oikeobacillus pervagus]|uniref:ATP synthase subunit delta n=1 Tax=Oikeobacillus pervagus TaxID=1325931 RepID=A0AAJ1T1A7_9BACI|nr:F0F1 ATP synthase subunit delta [Oikeobacillus pervagus]MDQ0214134.1 F-type H+-transporting ATPase subunit delta [Oikeobacillus pervagus]
MSNTAVAKRYALALFQIAKENFVIEPIEGELQVVKQVFNGHPDLLAILKSPKLTIDKKKEILKGAFSEASPYILNTLMLLTERHREDIIAEVAEAYIQLAYEERGVAEANVMTVRKLTKEEEQSVSSTFARKIGKNSLIINNIVDKNLLGGMKVRIGTRIYDGSIRGKLDRLGRELTV